MPEPTKENKGEFRLAEVATETKIVIAQGEKTYSPEEALVLVLNKLDKLEKKLVG